MKVKFKKVGVGHTFAVSVEDSPGKTHVVICKALRTTLGLFEARTGDEFACKISKAEKVEKAVTWGDMVIKTVYARHGGSMGNTQLVVRIGDKIRLINTDKRVLRVGKNINPGELMHWFYNPNTSFIGNSRYIEEKC